MLLRRTLGLGLLLSALSCGPGLTASRPDVRLAFESSSKEALVVLRVSPRTGVIVVGGTCEEHGWARNSFAVSQHFWSADEYIVVKATPTGEKEAYAVVAVRPERFTRFEDEQAYNHATRLWGQFLFDRGTFSPAAMFFIGLPAGFIVGALASASQGGPIDWGDEDKGQVAYSPGSGEDLPTFTALAGQVSYVGALRVEASQRKGAKKPPKEIAITPVRSAEDLPHAGQFMAARYPNVHVPATYRPLLMVTRDEPADDGF